MKKLQKTAIVFTVIIAAAATFSCSNTPVDDISTAEDAQMASRIIFQGLEKSYGTGGGSKAETDLVTEGTEGGSVTFSPNDPDQTDTTLIFEAVFNDFGFIYETDDGKQQTYVIDGTIVFAFTLVESGEENGGSTEFEYDILSDALTVDGPDITTTFPLEITYTFTIADPTITITATGTADGVPLESYTFTVTDTL
ncbi:MAG: hypothetical protein ACLFSE_09705 [Spirochaetia bacterium]